MFQKEIGGYFDLELSGHFSIDKECSYIPLNTGRNALRYIIRAYKIKEIYLPYYTCPVVYEAVRQEGCTIKSYNIDKSFNPVEKFEKDAYILYTNYYGICGGNIKALASQYKNLIADNAQAFYMPRYGLASFNSVRKFFGVPDGSFLYCDKKLEQEIPVDDTSLNRMSHLIKRRYISANEGFEDFKRNDEALKKEEIKEMSNLTKAMIRGIDTESAKEKRLENFRFLHENLKKDNELNISLDRDDVPMVYPFYKKGEGLKNKLINEKIYVATYWPNLDEDIERDLLKYLLALPIDQRYSIEDMKHILEILYE